LGAVSESSRPVYYGWWVLGAGAITEMLAIGSTSYAAGLFVLPLERELSLSRAAASSAIPIIFMGGTFMAVLIGYLLDRFPVQRVLSAGAVALGAGMVAVSLTSSGAIMGLALFFPIAFGFIAIGPLTTTTLVSRWFYRRRGRALGIAAVATSGGGIAVVPLLSIAIESYGWRTALQLEAALIVLIVLGLAAFVIRSGPGDLDLQDHPENERRPPAEVARRADAIGNNWTYARILSTANFWTIALALAVITAVNQAIVVTLVPYSVAAGFSSAVGALLISAFSVSAAIVKIVSGFAAEFVERRTIMFAAACSMILSLIVFLSSTDYAMLVLACCLAGAALGCILPSSAALIADCFGSASFGTIMGAAYVLVGVSSIVSVSFAGAVFDRTKSYEDAFLTFLALSVIAAVAALAVRAPRTLNRCAGAGDEGNATAKICV
jgi:MFS family permease